MRKQGTLVFENQAYEEEWQDHTTKYSRRILPDHESLEQKNLYIFTPPSFSFENDR